MITTVLWPPPSKVDAVLPALEQAVSNHKVLTDQMLALTSVSPGPYALFHHNSFVYERIEDVRLIFTRLVENRARITELHKNEAALRQEAEKHAEELKALFYQHKGVSQQMKLDMESLFVFGNLLLEQWTYVIHYLIGEPVAREKGFTAFVNSLQGKKKDKGLLQPLWDKHHKDILWLWYQIRNYRNIFIEHVRDPWQRGTAMASYGDDFRLSSPSSVGWISEDEIKESVNGIRHFAPQWMKHTSLDWYTQHPRQLLEMIFFYIDEIETQQGRDQVWQVWAKIGGWTFSYDMIAFRLMRFVGESMLTMLDVITQHPDKINVGTAPPGHP